MGGNALDQGQVGVDADGVVDFQFGRTTVRIWDSSPLRQERKNGKFG